MIYMVIIHSFAFNAAEVVTVVDTEEITEEVTAVTEEVTAVTEEIMEEVMAVTEEAMEVMTVVTVITNNYHHLFSGNQKLHRSVDAIFYTHSYFL